MYKILITGHTGAIGSYLWEKLNEDYKLIGFSKSSGQDLLTVNLNVDVDIVIHLAGLNGIQQSWKNPFKYLYNNIYSSYRIFKKFHNKKILYASTLAVKEWWRSPYAFSKYIIEKLAPNNAVGMRFANVYGGKIKKLIYKIKNNEVKYITNQTRDFVHLDDIVQSVKILIKNNCSNVVEIGSGKSVDLSSLVKNVEVKKGSFYEIKNSTANIRQLIEMGYRPQHNIIKEIK